MREREEIEVAKQAKVARLLVTKFRVKYFSNSHLEVNFKRLHYSPILFSFQRGLNLMLQPLLPLVYRSQSSTKSSVTSLGDLLDFGQLFKAFGNT